MLKSQRVSCNIIKSLLYALELQHLLLLEGYPPISIFRSGGQSIVLGLKAWFLEFKALLYVLLYSKYRGLWTSKTPVCLRIELQTAYNPDV
jgi:hypothetical protein